jgi:hypothetical protein
MAEEEDDCSCEPKDKDVQVYFNVQRQKFPHAVKTKRKCLQLYRKLTCVFVFVNGLNFQFVNKEW